MSCPGEAAASGFEFAVKIFLRWIRTLDRNHHDIRKLHFATDDRADGTGCTAIDSCESMGYYKFEEDDVVNKRDYAAYYAAVGGVGTQVMMLDTKRGVAKLVQIEDADAVQVRCIYDRDLLAEKGVDKNTMQLTDSRDNKKYKVELRAGKVWMKQNLAFSVTSEKQCYLDDRKYCDMYGRYYTYSDALRACPVGWHVPDDGEWRDYQKDRTTLDWEGLGRGGCQDWDNYCDGAGSGHYWSSTSILKNSARSCSELLGRLRRSSKFEVTSY